MKGVLALYIGSASEVEKQAAPIGRGVQDVGMMRTRHDQAH